VPPAHTQPAPAAVARSATQPAARHQPPQTQPAPEPKPALTHDEAVKKSRELYIQALEAEERGDYRKAKTLYEQIIKTLPPDTWYQGIEARLRIAKDMLGEK
jgi:TolA-binding protein